MPAQPVGAKIKVSCPVLLTVDRTGHCFSVHRTHLHGTHPPGNWYTWNI